MIRRDAQLPDGSPAWVLISQIEHARVAGDLAKDFCKIPPLLRDTLLPTIYRHDDGWRDWEAAPTIDPVHGRPRSFLEMPSDVAHEIWARSIAGVADLGPLAQYVVAQHFIRLRRSGGETGEPSVASFLHEYEGRSRRWLAQWQAENPADHTLAAAQAAVEYLQMFDALSLWLCCAGPTQPKRIVAPDNVQVTLTPAAGGRISARPWPWSVSLLPVAARGLQIHAAPLASGAELRTRLENADPVELRWLLQRE